MLGSCPELLLVRAASGYAAQDFAGDLHTALAGVCSASCWLHADHDLTPALQLAADLPHHPLVVTTSTSEWLALDRERDRIVRGASLAFVVADETLPRVPPQVLSLLAVYRIARKPPEPGVDPQLRMLLTECKRTLGSLIDDLGTLEMFAFDIGVEWARINHSGPTEVVAYRIIQEAERCRRLDHLVAELHRRYPREETNALRRRVVGLYYDSND